MGRRRKKERRSPWHKAVVADFLARHPDGMFRPLDLQAEPAQRIDSMPWWERRAALFLIGCVESGWDAERLVLWAGALAAAAEARDAALEIACVRTGERSDAELADLAAGFRRRPQPEDEALAYVHLVRAPLEHGRPPPLAIAEVIASSG